MINANWSYHTYKGCKISNIKIHEIERTFASNYMFYIYSIKQIPGLLKDVSFALTYVKNDDSEVSEVSNAMIHRDNTATVYIRNNQFIRI